MSEIVPYGRYNLGPQERQTYHERVAPLAAQARQLRMLRLDFQRMSGDEKALKELRRQSSGSLETGDRIHVDDALSSWSTEIAAWKEQLFDRTQELGLRSFEGVIEQEREVHNDIRSIVNETYRQSQQRRGLMRPVEGHQNRMIQLTPQYPEPRHIDQRAHKSPGRAHTGTNLPPENPQEPSRALVMLARGVAASQSGNNLTIVGMAEALPYLLPPHVTQLQRMARPDDFRNDKELAVEIAKIAGILYQDEAGMVLFSPEKYRELMEPDKHMHTIQNTLAEYVTIQLAPLIRQEVYNPNPSVQERNRQYRNIRTTLKQIAESMGVKGYEYLRDALDVVSPVLAAYLEPRLSSSFMLEVGLPMPSVITPQRYAELLRNAAYSRLHPSKQRYDEDEEEVMNTLLRPEFAERVIEAIYERCIGDDTTPADLPAELVFKELERLHPDYAIDILDRLFDACSSQHAEMLLQLMNQAGFSKAELIERRRELRRVDRDSIVNQLDEYELRKLRERRKYE